MRNKPWIGLTITGLLLALATGCGAIQSAEETQPESSPSGRLGEDWEADESASGGAISPPTPVPTQSPKHSKADKHKVLYLGDSLAVEMQNVLGERLKSTAGVSYASDPVAGNTVCDYLEGAEFKSILVKPEQKAAALVRELKPSVVVMQFRGTSWAYTPCMNELKAGTRQYYNRYAEDVAALTQQVAAAAASVQVDRPKIVWVLQPPEWQGPELSLGVNDIYRRQAAASKDLTADASSVLRGNDGKWAGRLPCDKYELGDPTYCQGGFARIHRDDDPLHFCLAKTPAGGRPCPQPSPGIARYVRVLAAVVSEHLK